MFLARYSYSNKQANSETSTTLLSVTVGIRLVRNTSEDRKITIRRTKAFVISLFAGILIIINGLILGVVSSFMNMIPTMASQYVKLSTIPTGTLQIAKSILTILTAVGVILGAIIALVPCIVGSALAQFQV